MAIFIKEDDGTHNHAKYFHKVRRDLSNEMSITKEEGGRLNAFAEEPRIEVMDAGSRFGNGFRLFLLVGTVLLVTLIAYTLRIS